MSHDIILAVDYHDESSVVRQFDERTQTESQTGFFLNGIAMTFAQAGRPLGGADDGVMVVVGIVILVILAGVLVLHIVYLVSLSKCFSRIAPHNRRMEPGMVWLNLIPCFGMIWIFITTSRLADSLRSEFGERGLAADGDFGRSMGTTYPILALRGDSVHRLAL